MTTELVEQKVSSWASWPDDVRDRLRLWNKKFLLSFHRTGDFYCEGCQRHIKGHPQGNAVVRVTRKKHGQLRCEDCLIKLARLFEWPPELDRFMAQHRAIVKKLQQKAETRLKYINRMEQHSRKMKRQAAVDDAYIELLEQHVSARDLEAVREQMAHHPLLRHRPRNPKEKALPVGARARVVATNSVHYGETGRVVPVDRLHRTASGWDYAVVLDDPRYQDDERIAAGFNVGELEAIEE